MSVSSVSKQISDDRLFGKGVNDDADLLPLIDLIEEIKSTKKRIRELVDEFGVRGLLMIKPCKMHLYALESLQRLYVQRMT